MTISASGSSRSQPESPGNAAQKLARLEVDPLGSRRRLTVVVALDPGNRVSSVRPRIPVNRILIQNTENLCHRCLTFLAQTLAWPGNSRPLRERSSRGGGWVTPPSLTPIRERFVTVQ